MAYRLHKFEDVLLPEYDPEPDFTQGPIDPTLLDSVGGVFDYYGGYQRLPRRQMISFRGVYHGETDYLVDHLGNQLVDHAGNALIAGDGPNRLRAQVDALTAMVGRRGRLYRQALEDDSRLEWKLARLAQVGHPRRHDHTPLLAYISCTFETSQAAWRSEEPAEFELLALIDDVESTQAFNLENGGNVRVDDATMIFYSSAGTLASVRVRSSAAGIDWSWAGSMPANRYLVVEAGAQRIYIASVNPVTDELTFESDAYSGFSYASTHTARGWLPLEPGLTPLIVYLSHRAHVMLEFYEQWL